MLCFVNKVVSEDSQTSWPKAGRARMRLNEIGKRISFGQHQALFHCSTLILDTNRQYLRECKWLKGETLGIYYIGAVQPSRCPWWTMNCRFNSVQADQKSKASHRVAGFTLMYMVRSWAIIKCPLFRLYWCRIRFVPLDGDLEYWSREYQALKLVRGLYIFSCHCESIHLPRDNTSSRTLHITHQPPFQWITRYTL